MSGGAQGRGNDGAGSRSPLQRPRGRERECFFAHNISFRRAANECKLSGSRSACGRGMRATASGLLAAPARDSGVAEGRGRPLLPPRRITEWPGTPRTPGSTARDPGLQTRATVLAADVMAGARAGAAVAGSRTTPWSTISRAVLVARRIHRESPPGGCRPWLPSRAHSRRAAGRERFALVAFRRAQHRGHHCRRGGAPLGRVGAVQLDDPPPHCRPSCRGRRRRSARRGLPGSSPQVAR